MITLRELFKVTWDITELTITARAPNMRFLHERWYAPDAERRETTHQMYDRLDGKLTVRNIKINAHGDNARNGPEMGWGVKEELLPKLLIDAPVTHLRMTSAFASTGGGVHVRVDVELKELQAQVLIQEEIDDGKD